MNDFIHKCPKCNTIRKYLNLKECFMDGNNISGLCYDCQKASVEPVEIKTHEFTNDLAIR